MILKFRFCVKKIVSGSANKFPVGNLIRSSAHFAFTSSLYGNDNFRKIFISHFIFHLLVLTAARAVLIVDVSLGFIPSVLDKLAFSLGRRDDNLFDSVIR